MELGLDGVLPGREGDLFSVDPGLVGCCGEEGGGIDTEDDRGVPDRAAPLGAEGPGAGDGRLVYLSKGEGEAGGRRQGLEGADFGEDPACGRIDEVRVGVYVPDMLVVVVLAFVIEGGDPGEPAVKVVLVRGSRLGGFGGAPGVLDFVAVVSLFGGDCVPEG